MAAAGPGISVTSTAPALLHPALTQFETFAGTCAVAWLLAPPRRMPVPSRCLTPNALSNPPATLPERRRARSPRRCAAVSVALRCAEPWHWTGLLGHVAPPTCDTPAADSRKIFRKYLFRCSTGRSWLS